MYLYKMKMKFFSNCSWQKRFLFCSFTSRRWQVHSRCCFYDKLLEFSLFCFTADFFVCVEGLCSMLGFHSMLFSTFPSVRSNLTKHTIEALFEDLGRMLSFIYLCSPCNLTYFKTGVRGAFKLGVLPTSLVQPDGTGYELKGILQSVPRRALWDKRQAHIY